MIILYQHERVFGSRFLCDSVGETFVDVHVILPIGISERRPNERDVAQRPQTFVGEAVIITVLLCFAQPDAPQRICRSARWDVYAVAPIDRFAVGAAAAVCDPGAAAGS